MQRPSHALRRSEYLMPLKEAAEVLSVSLRTIQVVVAAGDLPVVRVSPRRLAVHPDDLRDFIRRRREGGR